MTKIPEKSGDNQNSAAEQVWEMILSNWVAQAIYVAAELKIPDLLAGKSLTSDELAALTGTHPPSLLRLMRALATIEICREREDGSFELTAKGEILQSDHEYTLRSWALYSAGYLWPFWGHLLDSVKTGKSAREMFGGLKGFEHLERSPEVAALFNQNMAEQTRYIADDVVRSYDFSGAKRIVDVGGGNGQLLSTILQSYPNAEGVLFDLAHAFEAGKKNMAERGLSDRCEFVTGSFFESIPGGGDVYLLKSIIHDWPDEKSALILKNCAAAMQGAGKLLVIDRVYPDHVAAHPSHQLVARSDLNMLLGPGGRERMEHELRSLLRSTGFRMSQVIPLKFAFNIIEAFPA